MKTMTLTIVLVTAALIAPAYAETPSSSHSTHSAVVIPRSYLPSTAGYHSHSSTISEGYLRGTASVINSLGLYNYNTSVALINLQEARRRYVENKARKAQTYFAMRRANSEVRKQERGNPPTKENLSRYAKSRAPKRLNSHQYQAATGQLLWPALLENEYFAEERSQIDSLMKKRTQVGLESSNGEPFQLKYLAVTMRQKLKTLIGDISPSEYMAAKKILTSLEYEAQFTPDIIGIAAK